MYNRKHIFRNIANHRSTERDHFGRKGDKLEIEKPPKAVHWASNYYGGELMPVVEPLRFANTKFCGLRDGTSTSAGSLVDI